MHKVIFFLLICSCVCLSARAVDELVVNTAFDTFLRQAHIDFAHNTSSAQLSRHVTEHHHRLLELFVNLTARIYGNELVTHASSLVHSGRSTFKRHVEFLNKEVTRLRANFTGWPMVRRAITANLAIRFGKHGPFAAGNEVNSVQQLLLQLFFQHRDSARQRGVLEFAHVSKSGGTTFCQLARGNGCKSESFSPAKNCLVSKFKDEPRYLDGRAHRSLPGPVKTMCSEGFKTMCPRSELSCSKRRRWLQLQGYSMYANEYTALGGQTDPAKAHSCRNMLTVLELRHPHDRVLSHIRHMWHGYGIHCGHDRRLYFGAAAGGHNTSKWSTLIPAPTNNYLIRSLLGQAVFNLPRGGITRAHLDLARVLLAEQYDVILVLEDQHLSRVALRYGLGWGVHERHANPSRLDSEEGLPSDLEALWALNSLDVELYELGVLIAGLDGIVFAMARAVEEEGAGPVEASSEVMRSGESGDAGSGLGRLAAGLQGGREEEQTGGDMNVAEVGIQAETGGGSGGTLGTGSGADDEPSGSAGSAAAVAGGWGGVVGSGAVVEMSRRRWLLTSDMVAALRTAGSRSREWAQQVAGWLGETDKRPRDDVPPPVAAATAAQPPGGNTGPGSSSRWGPASSSGLRLESGGHSLSRLAQRDDLPPCGWVGAPVQVQQQRHQRK